MHTDEVAALAHSAACALEHNVCWVEAAAAPASLETHACVHGRSHTLNRMLARRLAGLPDAKSSARVHVTHDLYEHLYTHLGHAVFEVDVQPLQNATDARGLCEMLCALVTHQDMASIATPTASERRTVMLHMVRCLSADNPLHLCLKHLMDACADHTTFVFTCTTIAWLPESLRSRCANVRATRQYDPVATLRSACASLNEERAIAVLAQAGHDVLLAMLLSKQHGKTGTTAINPLHAIVSAFLTSASTTWASKVRTRNRRSHSYSHSQRNKAAAAGETNNNNNHEVEALRDVCLRVTASGVEVAELARATIEVVQQQQLQCSNANANTELMYQVVQLMADMEASCTSTSKELFVLEHYMGRLAALVAAGAANADTDAANATEDVTGRFTAATSLT